MAWLIRTGLLVSTAIRFWAADRALERFAHAGIEGGVVEIVLAVVLEKILERFLDFRLSRLVAQGAADQQRGAVADVGIYALVIERRHPHVAPGGVDGVGQIQARIDQGPVEVKDQQVEH